MNKSPIQHISLFLLNSSHPLTPPPPPSPPSTSPSISPVQQWHMFLELTQADFFCQSDFNLPYLINSSLFTPYVLHLLEVNGRAPGIFFVFSLEFVKPQWVVPIQRAPVNHFSTLPVHCVGTHASAQDNS